MAQTECLSKIFLSLVIVLLLVVNYTDFIIDHGITIINSHRLLERHESSLEAVEFEVFHTDVERGLVASREQSISSAVSIHGLVGFIERCEGMAKCNPPWSKMFVKPICFLEVFPGQVIFLDQEVV